MEIKTDSQGAPLYEADVKKLSRRRAKETQFQQRYGERWKEVLALYDEQQELRKKSKNLPRQARASVFSKNSFLRLISAQLENPKINMEDFVALSKMYAEIRGWVKNKKPSPEVRPEPKSESKPEPPKRLSEIELIQQIEESKRNNGT